MLMREVPAVAPRELESATGMSLTAMQRSSPCIFKNIFRASEIERDGEQHARCHQGINNKLLLDHSVLAAVGVALLRRRSLKFVLIDAAERSCTTLCVQLIPRKRLDESDLTRSKHEAI